MNKIDRRQFMLAALALTACTRTEPRTIQLAKDEDEVMKAARERGKINQRETQLWNMVDALWRNTPTTTQETISSHRIENIIPLILQQSQNPSVRTAFETINAYRVHPDFLQSITVNGQSYSSAINYRGTNPEIQIMFSDQATATATLEETVMNVVQSTAIIDGLANLERKAFSLPPSQRPNTMDEFLQLGDPSAIIAHALGQEAEAYLSYRSMVASSGIPIVDNPRIHRAAEYVRDGSNKDSAQWKSFVDKHFTIHSKDLVLIINKDQAVPAPIATSSPSRRA